MTYIFPSSAAPAAARVGSGSGREARPAVRARIEALGDREEPAGLPHHPADGVDLPVEVGGRDVAAALRHGAGEGPRRLLGTGLAASARPDERGQADCERHDERHGEDHPHCLDFDGGARYCVSASAPATTSRISCVISAWRARFMSSVSRVDQLARVLRGAPHRGHLGAVLRRRRLEQRPVDGGLEIGREQALQDLLRLWLVDEVALERDLVRRLLLLILEDRARDREQVLDLDGLGQRRDVMVVDDDDAIHLALGEELRDLVGDRPCV